MALFIKGMGNISPQNTWDVTALPDEIVRPSGDRFAAIEPDYSQFIDPKNIRRMSRIIKLGVSAATIALRQTKITAPDAIITGTGYGCLEDTGTFLSKMIANKEEALNPTPFIQSTHNTIGSQIALLLQCQAYNQTYAHGAFSFESALLDALIQSDEDSSKNILIGAVDEITNVSHSIQKRFGLFRKTVNGEGAAFFVAGGSRDNSSACIDSVATLYKPNTEQLQAHVASLGKDFDMVLLGINITDDSGLVEYCEKSFPSVASFKHLSGEHPVASSFGLWLAVTMLQMQAVPKSILLKGNPQSLKKILVVNRYFGTHYSTISVSC
jgi:3-oxoacyl-[acyl-carrier-protein] synthase II